MSNPDVELIMRFMPQKHAEFERLTSIEYPNLSLAKSSAVGYVDPATEKLWTFWLQAYRAGKEGLIERPDDQAP